MLVGDLVYNDDIECHCHYDIYDAESSKLIISTKRDGFHKPLDKILDMRVKYITIEKETLVIEATHCNIRR